VSQLLQLYFACAVRGAEGGAIREARLRALERFGVVTTRHLADPHRVERLEDDAALYAWDERLLAGSDVFIGDFTAPSTGSGFMAARALELGKPVLALFGVEQRPSAMLAGHPRVVTGRFDPASEVSLMAAVRAFLLPRTERLRAPQVVLSGPPGSGKGTLGAALARAWALPHLSTGELLRDLVRTRPADPLAVKVDGFMKAGALVPAELMRALVLDRLAQPDCQRLGFILDGYPPSRADLENLSGLQPDVVFLLECDDDTAVQRQVSRAARSTDTPEKARARLEVYRREAVTADWFPRSVTVRLDASRPADEVLARALETLEGLVGEARRTRSFFPVPALRASDVRTTRVHFHLDAPSTEAVRALAHEVYVRHPAAQGQLKLYPIDSLSLGPQVKQLGIYGQLPNFRPISAAEDEAFITGRLGDGDEALMRAVLDVARVRGGMAELEEYTGEWTLLPGGEVRVESRYDALPAGTFDWLPAEGRCSDFPKLELHLGFDVPRMGGALPIALPELVARCTDAGLCNGGWFVFKKDGLAAYRSNEFSNATVAEGEARVAEQARRLAALLRGLGFGATEVSFSLELVHGIWTFP
jgi:adenylate kinase